MASFGEQLRQAREMQNITLQEIAVSTKISSRALQALESEHFEQLPGGIFNKGFVRAYARYVGLDEEKMVASYIAAAKPGTEDNNELETICAQVEAQHPKAESSFNPSVAIGVVAVIVALGLSGVWLREHRREARQQAMAAVQPALVESSQSSAVAAAAEPPAVAKSETIPQQPNQQPAAIPQSSQAPAPATVAPSSKPAEAVAPPTPQPATAAAAVSASQSGPVEVSVQATQKAWISVHSDGKLIEAVLMDPENPKLSQRTYKAKEKVRMVVGNAGGVNIVYNGKPAGPLGKEGEATTLTFTPEGIKR